VPAHLTFAWRLPAPLTLRVESTASVADDDAVSCEEVTVALGQETVGQMVLSVPLLAVPASSIAPDPRSGWPARAGEATEGTPYELTPRPSHVLGAPRLGPASSARQP
jgi:hypothetical protein